MMKKTMVWVAVALMMMASVTACSSNNDNLADEEPVEPVDKETPLVIPTNLELTRAEQAMVN